MNSMYNKIKTAVETIRNAVYGLEVRSSIANAVEAINEKTEDLSTRQDCLGDTFEQLILDGGNTDAEVILSRTCSDGTKYESVPKRLDAIEIMLKGIKNDLENGVYSEISFDEDMPSPEGKATLWIPVKKNTDEGEPPDTGGGDNSGDLDPTPPEEGDTIAVKGDTFNAIFNTYVAVGRDSLGNTLVGYPDELTCAAPSNVGFGTKVLVKNTGTELDGKIFTVTDRAESVKVKDDGSYVFALCMKDEETANKLGTTFGKATVGTLVTSTSKIATVTANALTVRSGPGVEYTAIAYVQNGYVFMILETYENSRWIKVDFNGKEAFVSGAYCNITTIESKDDIPEQPDIGDITIDKNNPSFGVDVSKHNGIINWTKAKAAGVQFAIIRMGYGLRASKGGVLDSQFANNVAGATAAGIPIGVYFFSYASTLDGLKAEANFVISELNKYPGGTFAYPIFFDQEYDSLNTVYNSSTGKYTTYNPGKTVLTSYMTTFYKMLTDAGYYCGIYGNPDWFLNKINFDSIKDYPIWLAQWSSKATWSKSEFGLWQYGTGTVNGISTAVDVNRGYINYPVLIKALHKNGF